MTRIISLDPTVANAIAAGEVVERPASVIKELIENALDAGSSVITVEIEDGGIKMMRVTDNGIGMDREDAVKAFECHATSKVKTLDDLNALSTMGFRGEALSSVASVSRVTLKTSPMSDKTGTLVEIEAGKVLRTENCASVQGTQITVRDLFFNQPARYKFLKKDHTEAQHIIVLCERFVLIRPDVSFRLIKNGKSILHSPGNSEYKDALYCVYGSKVLEQCYQVDYLHEKIQVCGFAGSTAIARSSRGEQTIFVNDRLIRSKTISAAIDQAYQPYLMKGKHAFVVLYVNLPSGLVDVNVHPQKSEVRFWNDNEVFRSVFHALKNALASQVEASEPEKTTPTPSDTSDSNLIDQIADNFSKSKCSHINMSSETDAPSHSVNLDMHPSERLVFDAKQSITFPISPSINSESLLPISDQVEMSIDTIDTSHVTLNPRDRSLLEIARAQVIGVLFSTYILLQTNDAFYLLDQHAAHEKVLFESLMQNHHEKNESTVATQTLLMPEIISLSRSEMSILEKQTDNLNRLGFEFSPIGQMEIAIRAVPSCAQTAQIRNMFLSILDQLQSEIKYSDRDLYQRLATSACKAAVKANDRLSNEEIIALISQLMQLDEPFHCPHGRPIVIRYNKGDIEKWFKRIV